MIPPLELSGNKRVYTDNHLLHFRAIITLARTGETLAAIQKRLKDLPLEEIRKIGDQMPFYEAGRVLQSETHQITEDVAISLSSRISPELNTSLHPKGAVPRVRGLLAPITMRMATVGAQPFVAISRF
jgi:DNA-binding transcriptional MerR regulator